ncbi:MAG TPA: hypothetical protein VGI55_11730 [Solirubrobacteraceae bacterium]
MSVAEALATENPLAEGLEPPPLHATGLVIFGATGDLARRSCGSSGRDRAFIGRARARPARAGGLSWDSSWRT